MKKKYKIIIGVIILLIIIRLILPYVVLHYANKTLAKMQGYYGHIEDIDLCVFNGAYIIKNIYLNKVDTSNYKQIDFFKSKIIDLSIEWNAILEGSLVGELKFDSPILIFTKDKVELSDVTKDSSDFRKLLKDFMPLRVNRFEVFNGNLHYVDNTSNPKVNVSLKKTHILAFNLSNVTNETIELPSTLKASGLLYEGTLTFDMKLNVLNKHPTFDLNSELKNTNLVLINDFLKAYGNFDVNKGTFGLYTEIAAKNGKFKGYFKPIIKNLDVVGLADKNDKFFNKVYEHIIGAAGVILKNPKKKQVASKIEIEGDFNNPKTNVIDAIFEVLKNAYIQALVSSVDHEISLKSVDKVKPKEKRNIFKRIFQSKKKKANAPQL